VRHYDVIVIGTGAGGGTLVHQLALAGREVLVLERGSWLPQEKQNWDASEVFTRQRYVSADTWLDRDGKPFQPGIGYWVGGQTKFYGAALFRLRPSDFAAHATGSGLSTGWPVSYADFEPYYSAAEQLYQVHGRHGDDPTEGPWSRQYPFPGVSHSPRIAQIAGDLSAAGYQPFTAPSAVMLNEADPGKSKCIRCSTCDGHPCQVHAKADAEVIAVRPVMGLPNVTLITNCEVKGIVPASRNQVNGVYARVNGTGEFFHADTVVLAAGAVNTAKILLASGLANNSGQVGRNYMCHVSRAVMAVDRVPNWTTFQKTLALNDFYHADPEAGRFFPLGGIQMVGKSCAAAMRSESRLAALMPEWPLAKIARHAVDFWLTTEDIADPRNRVSLRGDQVQLSYAPNNQPAAHELYRELRVLMNRLGIVSHHVLDKSVFASHGIGLSGVAHQAGTCRMGADPASSVTDAWGRCHDLENLYIADASVMPSVGAVNPALTVMAHALRVSDRLTGRA
jgi:choline dehydrogenase-like flavoprotein